MTVQLLRVATTIQLSGSWQIDMLNISRTNLKLIADEKLEVYL